MRQFTGGIAWIERNVTDQPEWLLVWIPGRKRYSLVGGELDVNESFQVCIERNLEDDLQLHRDLDFQVSEQSLAKLEYNAFSDAARVQTRYRHAIFRATLTDVSLKATEATQIYWATAAEIEKGTTTGSDPIADLVVRTFLAVQKSGSLDSVPMIRREAS